jgi:flagellar P-ring protein precursor FlgI
MAASFKEVKIMTRKVQIKSLQIFSIILATVFMVSSPVLTPDATASSRIKDIVSFEGVRENQLIGYGLVVGLNGTGDTLQNAPFTRQSLEAMLERMGINTRGTSMRTANVAAVMVTAALPPFARPGMKLDVIISAMGDAGDLRGGTLLVTPLLGADGEVYAVSQGSLAVAGFTAGGDGGSITQGVPTTARIANGGIVERQVSFELNELQSVKLSLTNPDFTTARRIAIAINEHMGSLIANAVDSSTVRVMPPIGTDMAMVDLITNIEQVSVVPDQPARVVIDDRSGIIVMGSEVRVNTVAIAQGNLTIRISENPQVSQANAFAEGGETVVVPDSNIEIDTGEDKRLTVMSPGVTLQELVDALNTLGVGPRDMISILQAIKVAGAMQADIVVM